MCLDDIRNCFREIFAIFFFFEFIDFVFTPLCEKDFYFHVKELGVNVVDYKYEICLDDIFNCFGEIFVIFFSEFMILFLLFYARRTFAFTKRSLGYS